MMECKRAAYHIPTTPIIGVQFNTIPPIQPIDLYNSMKPPVSDSVLMSDWSIFPTAFLDLIQKETSIIWAILIGSCSSTSQSQGYSWFLSVFCTFSIIEKGNERHPVQNLWRPLVSLPVVFSVENPSLCTNKRVWGLHMLSLIYEIGWFIIGFVVGLTAMYAIFLLLAFGNKKNSPWRKD